MTKQKSLASNLTKHLQNKTRLTTESEARLDAKLPAPIQSPTNIREIGHIAGNQAVQRWLAASSTKHRMLQRMLLVGSAAKPGSAIVVPQLPESAPMPPTNDVTKMINKDLSENVQKLIYLVITQNKSNRYVEFFEPPQVKPYLRTGKTKIKGEPKDLIDMPFSLTIEMDIAGATHGKVPTPHIKVWIKGPGDKSFFEPFAEVKAVGESQILNILQNKTMGTLLHGIVEHVQKYYTYANFKEKYTW